MDIAHWRPVAQTLFDELHALGFDGVGITRASYGAGESAAAEHLRAFAARHGLASEPDRAGNLVFRAPGPTAPAVAWAGSHIDSVPQGGHFDGLAGVVAGLLCLLERQRSGSSALPLEVLAFRGEESAWFGKAHVGSGALLGSLSRADLDLQLRGGGPTLGEAMAQVGADVVAIRDRVPLVDLKRVKAYLELHIEQGPVLVAGERPLGVVSGIRGNIRHNRIVCQGEAQHSGVVPRGLRRDAMFAVADLIMRIDHRWQWLLEGGVDLVVTTGIVGTDPAEHAISRIPGQVTFSFEARSESRETLQDFHAWLLAECEAVARERGVDFGFDRCVRSEPARMSPALRASLAAACEAQGTAFDLMPSGAGHDASLFANAGVPSGMLFVRNQHGSHNPNEAMEMDDFMLGVQALHATLLDLAPS